MRVERREDREELKKENTTVRVTQTTTKVVSLIYMATNGNHLHCDSITHTETYAGCPVCRVVSLFDTVCDLVKENDCRLLLEMEPQEIKSTHPGIHMSFSIEYHP
jgi:hypothetical protein